MRRMICAALALAFAAPALAADPTAGLSPLSPGALGGVTVTGSNLVGSQATANGTVRGNVVGADRGGAVTNGGIAGNAVTGNRGVTSVMMNSGNNVSFNNATIVNVIVPGGVK
jgi:hypothetical protein